MRVPNDLMYMAKELNELYELSYNQIKPQVTYIIKNNIKDINFIDHVFDELLNIPTEKCYKLFTRLCTYVETFNQDIAKEYVEIYQELYGQEEHKKKKYKWLYFF